MTDFLVGPHWSDLGMFLIRLLLGGFMVLYRFRWFYDPTQPDPWFSQHRRHMLTVRLCSCNYSHSFAMCFLVASVEILAGLALIVGLLAIPAAFGILIILSFATWCTAWENTAPQNPVDCVDVVSCYLRTIEPLYITMALAIVLMGPGQWSLDTWVWKWLGL
jgi:uncharacterized membrane protein YphA (DoxX/SURF4 family)